MAKQQEAKKKGAPRSAGSRKHKIAAYYDVRYPERKLRHMAKNGASVAMLRQWADGYKTPSGMSGAASLIKIGKLFKLNVNQQ